MVAPAANPVIIIIEIANHNKIVSSKYPIPTGLPMKLTTLSRRIYPLSRLEVAFVLTVNTVPVPSNVTFVELKKLEFGTVNVFIKTRAPPAVVLSRYREINPPVVEFAVSLNVKLTYPAVALILVALTRTVILLFPDGGPNNSDEFNAATIV